MTHSILSSAGVLALFLLSITCLFFARRLREYNPILFRKNKDRYRSISDVFFGRATLKHDYIPDSLVQAGMSYNTRDKKIEANGKISDEVVEEFIGR